MKLPNGWEISQLSELTTIVRGSSPRPAGDPKFFDGSFLPWITVGEVTRDAGMYLRDTRSFLTAEGAKRTRILDPETLILTNSGATLGVPKITMLRAGANDGIAAFLEPNAEKRFLYYFLQSKTRYFREEVAPGVGQPNLNTELIGLVVLWLPPRPEQLKIADILSTWDEATQKLDALITAKERHKQALMQQLLTGKKRVKGATEKWKKLRFGDFLTESRIAGTDGASAKKVTIKLYGRGVHAKQDRLAGSENTKYYIRKAGQFIYSKLDFLNGAFGIVPDHLDGYESTLDLPSFDVAPSADARWLLYFVTRPEFYSQQLGAAAGGRKARRVNPSEFLAMKVLAPTATEQKQIATILDTADQELTLLRSQRETLDQQKRGLMQRLLTGKLRVSL